MQISSGSSPLPITPPPLASGTAPSADMQAFLDALAPGDRAQAIGYIRQTGAQSAQDLFYKVGDLSAQNPAASAWLQSALKAAEPLLPAKDLAWLKVGLAAQNGAVEARKAGEEAAEVARERRDQAFKQQLEDEALRQAALGQAIRLNDLDEDAKLKHFLEALDGPI